MNSPLFMGGDPPYRGSIEGGYASMLRFIAAHPNPWGWNPAQYCGMPTALIYLPLVHYLAAPLLWIVPGLDAAHAHRIVTTAFACLAPVSVFFFVRYFTRSRWWAFGAALSYTFFSPLYGLIEAISRDRGDVYLPWRLQVLVKYGEGPHTVGLALLPPALVAIWSAGASPGFRRLLIAAMMAAAVALTNWVAALALTLSVAAMLLTAAGMRKESGFRISRVIAAGALAWLLAAFWMTPAFIRNIAFNWTTDSLNFDLRTPQYALLGGCVASLVLLRLILLRYLPRETYLCFVTLACLLFGWIVQVRYSYGIDTIPESHRYALEFSMFLLLALFAWFRLAMRSGNGVTRFCAIGPAAVMLITGAPDALTYVSRSHEKWKPVPKEQTVEYRLARWLDERHPAGRVMASGGLRYRLNMWFDIPQVGGAFESGLSNRIPHQMAFRVRTGTGSAPGEEGRNAIVMMKSLGVEYVVVHGPASKEHYRDYKHPAEFEGLLEQVYREEGDVIYRIPFTSLAHLVRPDQLPGEFLRGYEPELARYVAAIGDNSVARLRVEWQGTRSLAIEGPIQAGHVISLQVSFDPGWTATQAGHSIRIDRDNIGFMVLHPAPASSARIEMRYNGTREQHLTALISALAWAGSIAGLSVSRRAKPEAA
ncbi:MAG: hypothetical protein EXQ52_04060 [Bryobacterales bacterium]|nr:hypothetical protein [Bryobacterales bacterium]